jgi:hypothetical protein
MLVWHDHKWRVLASVERRARSERRAGSVRPEPGGPAGRSRSRGVRVRLIQDGGVGPVLAVGT